MKRSRLAPALFSAVLILACASPCLGQLATGTPQFGSYSGGPDIINLSNLNSHITVPMINKAGRQMAFTYDLSYDSAVWFPSSSSGTNTWTPIINWGWRGQTEVSTGYITYTLQTTYCGNGGSRGGVTLTYSNWNYHDTFGVTHPFSGSTITYTGTCGGGTSPLNALATDGSGYTINASGTSATITPRWGGVIAPPVGQTGGAGKATDKNGNQISVSNNGVFTDTLGQTALTVTGFAPNPMTFAYTAPSGSNVSYSVKYTPYTVQTNFGCSGIGEYSATNVSLVSEIDLPDGATKYTFTYEPTPGHSGDVTGRLASVTYPTGGTISYAYSGGNNNTGINCRDGSVATLTRTTPDGVWMYALSEADQFDQTTTVTDPQGNQTVVDTRLIYEVQRSIYQGSASSGTLLETINTCYNGGVCPCAISITLLGLPVTERNIAIVIPNYSGLQMHSDIHYNSAGLVTEEDDYDWGADSFGPLIRKTLTTYATLGNGIVDRPASITVQDGLGNVKSQTTYTYDQGTPVATSGTPQHISVTGSRGNITKISSLVSGSATLNPSFTYFDTGTVQTATDTNGAATTNVYSSTGSCGNSFPTSINEPLGMSTSTTWNCTGGVAASATDENAKITTITRNDPNYWRVNSLTDPALYVVNSTYSLATSVESSMIFNSNTSIADLLTTLDSLGRVHLMQEKTSPSSTTYDSRETDYDSVGRPSRFTLPYSATAGAPNSTAPGVTVTYDAFGRILSEADSGGGTTTYFYNQSDILITAGPAPTGESTKSRQYEYDGLGRLTSVCEITSLAGSGSCGQRTAAVGFLTKYSYDANNNLIGVIQNAQSSSTQTRSYSYDDLKRMTSEQNPESGTTTYIYDTDSNCGSFSGDLVKKVDAVGNVICYSHDALHRLTSITYPSGAYAANTSNKYFVYDTATVNGNAMTNGKGRVVEAYTSTCQTTCSKITDLGFSYTVRGELTDVYQSSPHSGGYYHVNATYWANGALNQIGGLSGLPVLTYTPDGEGRPTIVSASTGQNPVVSSTLYNTASFPTSMTLGSSDSDSFTFDQKTNRMLQFSFAINNQTLTGTIGWNPIGTPSSLDISDPFDSQDTQNCSYAHDDLARISKVNCGVVWGQSFTYDAYGNITKSVLSGSNGTSFQPTYAASPPTNRIASLPGNFIPTYDANGNLTKDSFHQYAWDSEGRPVTIDAVTLTYDALNRLVEQSLSTQYTQTVYNPLGAKFALMNGQTLQKAFAPLPDGGLAAYTSSGLAYYRHPDRLRSSPIASTRSRGIYADVAYSPFGEPYAQIDSTDLDFTGENEDTVSTLYDFLHREYSPNQGRWVSPDPAGVAAISLNDPQSWNRYAYVRNSPLTLVDMLGLSCIDSNGNDLNIEDKTTCDGIEGTFWIPTLNQTVTVNAPLDDPATDSTAPQDSNLPQLEQPQTSVFGPNGGTFSQMKNACVNNFYSSKAGKVTQLGSALSIVPGWNPNFLSNIGENVVLLGGKFAVLKGLISAGQASVPSIITGGVTSIAGPLETLAGAAAGKTLAVAEAGGPPVVAAATIADMAAHSICIDAALSQGTGTSIPD
jgi:RHS repeat-associated protein